MGKAQRRQGRFQGRGILSDDRRGQFVDGIQHELHKGALGFGVAMRGRGPRADKLARSRVEVRVTPQPFRELCGGHRRGVVVVVIVIVIRIIMR